MLFPPMHNQGMYLADLYQESISYHYLSRSSCWATLFKKA